MNNSRVVFKPWWLLPLAVISIAFMALAFWAATPNKAEAQSGGPGNGGEGGGGHDLGAFEHCIQTNGPGPGPPVVHALAKLNARAASGHSYELVEVIACGIKFRGACEPDKMYAFRFIVDDVVNGEVKKRFEKNVKVCHP